jgi:hypothetical protein
MKRILIYLFVTKGIHLEFKPLCKGGMNVESAAGNPVLFLPLKRYRRFQNAELFS